LFFSSRSIAFTRKIWERVGGYPEIALTAEDSLFDERLRELGVRFVFTDKAIAYCKPRSSWGGIWKQFFRYSKGDAICGLHGSLHLRLSAKYVSLFAVILLSFHERAYLVLAIALVILY